MDPSARGDRASGLLGEFAVTEVVVPESCASWYPRAPPPTPASKPVSAAIAMNLPTPPDLGAGWAVVGVTPGGGGRYPSAPGVGHCPVACACSEDWP